MYDCFSTTGRGRVFSFSVNLPSLADIREYTFNFSFLTTANIDTLQAFPA
jgi:hypothetical protein